jgi:hypothetical protein
VNDDRVYLIHIKEAIDDIREFTRDGETAFLGDKKTPRESPRRGSLASKPKPHVASSRLSSRDPRRLRDV